MLVFSSRFFVCLALCVVCVGCTVPRVQYDAMQSQNRALSEHNRTLMTELNNLKSHSRTVEDRLISAEEELAVLDERVDLDRKQLANYQREREELRDQFMGVVNSRSSILPEVSGRLAKISQKYDGLRFDPATGLAKLDTDILFDSGMADLKPGAEKLLKDLVRVLNSPEARDLRIMAVGHTDDQQIAKKPAREKYRNNFHLSSARALTVTDRMRRLGLKHERVGIAGFGPDQPIAPNISEVNSRKNRRVEIFVMAPEVPVVGWTDTIPSVY